LIQSNDAPGLTIAGDTAFVNVRASSLVNNAGDGVRNEGTATVILSGDAESGNAIHDNTGFGANQVGTAGQIVASYNWWGDPSGPTHTTNPAGSGEAITDRVLYDPWLRESPAPPTVATQLVQTRGPLKVSPGDTVNLGIFVNNLLTATLTDTVAVMQLSNDVEYLMSTSDGQYWPSRHQVVWQLGNTAPHTTWQEAVQVRPVWGLPLHHKINSIALVAAENHPNGWITLDEYQTYAQLYVVSTSAVSDPELAALRTSEPDMDALYQDAVAKGFLYYGAAKMEQLSNGSERLALVMINSARPGERIDLYRDDDGAIAVQTTPLFEEIYDLNGALRFYFDTGTVEARGTLQHNTIARFPVMTPCTPNSCEDFGYDDCLRNCMIHHIDAGQFAAHYSSKCAACYKSGENCLACAHYLYTLRNDTIKNSMGFCYDICTENMDNGKCTEPTRDCVTSHTYIETPCIDCEYATDLNTWGGCKENERCINGSCQPIKDPRVDEHQLEILTAGDPNEMYGPSVVTPGAWITYTIAYENVGSGNAYGVYIISHLPAALAPTTLHVANGGAYLPGSRTLLWDVGHLGPSEGGEVHFMVQVPSSIPSDTVIIAGATVYFPSVPETTPTNDVVTIVGEVVGHDQQVETDEETPVAITLTGTSPASAPLTYTIERQPVNGALSGAPPNLTYTPAETFEGLDSFSFRVDDGADTSRPAEVTLQVHTGEETTPPEVVLTVPEDGATDVRVYGTPVFTGTYYPNIWIKFDEPISATTVNTQTFFIRTEQGRQLQGSVAYNDTVHVATFTLNEPLTYSASYSATVSDGIYDTSGNALASQHTWRFTTATSADHTIYLPLIMRGH
jgi:uncharacterized repeat protein (TIGR01451 family)